MIHHEFAAPRTVTGAKAVASRARTPSKPLPPDLKPVGIERLVEWTFGDEKASLDPAASTGRFAIPKHLQMRTSLHAFAQMEALGVRVDVSAAGATFLASEACHWDAEAVAACVSGYFDLRTAQMIETYGRTGTRPNAMVGSEPKIEPEDWGSNAHGPLQFARAVPAGPNEYRGGVWRPEMQAIRKKARGVDRFLGHCTPIVYCPHPGQIKSAREAYLKWWEALHQLREVLIDGQVLKSHRLTGEIPPAFPWLVPSETEVVETGPRPDWRG